eukprot:Hpha_TRINITY_DN16036_c3_g11::TRINITY_DN16036_c3_g11_i1::g.120682::m.120682
MGKVVWGTVVMLAVFLGGAVALAPPPPTHSPHVANSTSGSGSGDCRLQGAHAIEYKPEDAPHVLLFVFFSVTVGSFIKILQNYFFPPLQKIPYTVLLFCMGMVLEWMSRAGGANGAELGAATRSVISMDPHLVLHVFLPPLLFESAFNMESFVLKKCMGQALLLAFPGVLIAAGLTGVMLKFWYSSYDWGWALAFMFGSMVSATDPVAVVALLSELGAPKPLSTLIEGESLMNDGSAFVVFLIFKEFAAFGGAAMTVGEVFEDAFRLSFGAAGLGLLFGIVLTQLLLRFTQNEPVVEIPMTVATAYLAFWAAEASDMQVSGVLTVVIMGMFVGSPYGRQFLSPEVGESMEHVWHVLGHVANTVLFVIAGGVTLASMNRGKIEGVDWANLVVLYITVHITRAVTIIVFWPLLQRIGYPISVKRGIIVWFGGLRGAIGLVLALIVSHEACIPLEERDHIQFLTAGLVALTTLVNGFLAGPLYRGLGLAQLPSGHLTTLKLSVDLMEGRAEAFMEAFAKKPWWDSALEGSMYRELEWVRQGRRDLAGVTNKARTAHTVHRAEFNEKLRDLVVLWFHKQKPDLQLTNVRHIQPAYSNLKLQTICNSFVALCVTQLKEPVTGGSTGGHTGRNDFDYRVTQYWYRFELNMPVHVHFLSRKVKEEPGSPLKEKPADEDTAEGEGESLGSRGRQDSIMCIKGRETEMKTLGVCREYIQKDISKHTPVDFCEYSKLQSPLHTVYITKHKELFYDAPYDEEELYHRAEEQLEDEGEQLRFVPWYPNLRKVAKQNEPWKCLRSSGMHADGFHATEVHYLPLVEEIREDVRRITLQGVKAHYRKWHEERIIDAQVFGSLMEAVLFVEDEDRIQAGGVKRYDLEEEWARLRESANLNPFPIEYTIVSRAPPTVEVHAQSSAKKDPGSELSGLQRSGSWGGALALPQPLTGGKEEEDGSPDLLFKDMRVGQLISFFPPREIAPESTHDNSRFVGSVVEIRSEFVGEGIARVRFEPFGGAVEQKEIDLEEEWWDEQADAFLVQACKLEGATDFSLDGIVVDKVVKGSRAESAGLRRGQKFVLINGAEVMSDANVLEGLKAPVAQCFLTKRPREALAWGLTHTTVKSRMTGEKTTKHIVSAVPRFTDAIRITLEQGTVAEGKRTVSLVCNSPGDQACRLTVIDDADAEGGNLSLDAAADAEIATGDARRKLLALEPKVDKIPTPAASFFLVDNAHLLWGPMTAEEKKDWKKGRVRDDGVTYTKLLDGDVDRSDPRLVEVVYNVPCFDSALFIARHRMWGRLQVPVEAYKQGTLEESLGIRFLSGTVSVASVDKDSPAHHAGVREGFVLSQLNKLFFSADCMKDLVGRAFDLFRLFQPGVKFTAGFTPVNPEDLDDAGQTLANTQVDAFTWYSRDQRDREPGDVRPLKGARNDSNVWGGTLFLFCTHWRRYPTRLGARPNPPGVNAVSCRLFQKYSVFQSVLHPDYFLVGHAGKIIAEHAPEQPADFRYFMERASFKV